MTTLTYQVQLQQQHQEGGAPDPAVTGNPADGPVPDGFGDDDIISDLLGGGDKGKGKGRERPERPRAEADEGQAPEETEEPAPPDDDPEEQAAPDEEEEEEDEDLPAAAETDEPIEGSLEEARAARAAGDLDKACQIAFGCKPEELAPKAYDWTKWRAANDKAHRGLDKRAQEINATDQQNRNWVASQRQQINHIIEQLRPYEEVQLGLLAFEKDGDPEPLVRLIEKRTQLSWADFNKAAITKTRRSPQERQLAERLQQLERQLQEREREREQQTEQQTQQQAYQADLAHIRQAVKGDVTKIPKFAERIYQILAKTRGPLGLTKTIDQAAQMVIRAERKRIETHPFVRKSTKGKVPPPVSNAARTLAARASNKNRPPLRRDSQNNGAPNREAENDDDIINDILTKRPARRSA